MVIFTKISTRTALAVFLFIICCRCSDASDVVLLDFSSATCAPCQEMRPIVRRLAASGYRIRHVDIAREPELASQFRVDQVPTFVSLVDGREYARMVGAGTYEQLQQILSPGAIIKRGQSPDPTSQADIRPASASEQAAPMANYSHLDTPQAGRIIELQDPNQRSTVPAPTVNPFGNTQAAQATLTSTANPIHAKLVEASVKISVEDAEGTSAGTGTIVDAREGAALVLTCGHIFRTSAGKGPITITFFQMTPTGVQARETVAGQLLNYDLERDLALVVVRTASPVKAIPIAPANTPIAPGGAVTTVGCNNGANPTAIDSRITTIDRYQGPPNIEVSGAPVEGRSGGGLFNQNGELIGVCFAADPQSNEGLYASLPSIQAKLDSLNLTMVYQTPSTGTSNPVVQATAAVPAAQDSNPTTPPPVATAPQPVAIRGQDELVDRLPDAFSPAQPQTLSSAEQTALEEIQRRGLNSEVICIIRPHDPAGKSEVITLNNVSPQFVNSLAHPEQAPSQHSAATAAAGQLLRR